MKTTSRWIAGIVFFLIQIQTSYAQEDIPNEFSAMAVDAPDSYEFVKACVPWVTEQSYNDSIQQAGDHAIVMTWPNVKAKPFLAVTKDKVFCVRRSGQGNPLLPVSVFDETVDFPEMSKDDVKRFRTDLSKQLAKGGSAMSLVVLNDSGNAYQIAFLFDSDRPSRLYYHVGFLKKGEFDEQKFSSVYRTSGSMSLTGRGPLAENYKLFLK